MSPKKQNKEYYAVIHGVGLDCPTIFSSWGDAHPRVTGVPGNKFAGFKTLSEAEEYMRSKGVVDCKKDIKMGAGETTPIKGQLAFYAVANGREIGVYEYYYGGAEPKVNEFSGMCHKHFRKLEQADAFINDWRDSSAHVAKEKKMKGLQNDHRREQMQGTPVPLTRNREGTIEELTADLARTMI